MTGSPVGLHNEVPALRGGRADGSFTMGITHYDEPPPDFISGSEELKALRTRSSTPPLIDRVRPS